MFFCNLGASRLGPIQTAFIGWIVRFGEQLDQLLNESLLRAQLDEAGVLEFQTPAARYYINKSESSLIVTHGRLIEGAEKPRVPATPPARGK